MKVVNLCILLALAVFLGSSLWAVPVDTPQPGTETNTAAAMLKGEEQFQSKLTELTQVVSEIEKRVKEMKLSAEQPSSEDMERLNKELSLTDDEISKLSGMSNSPLAQVQQTDLRDRLLNVELMMEMIKRRWGGESAAFGIDFFKNTTIQQQSLTSLPKDYRIRSGDKLNLSAISKLGSQNNYELTVDPNGSCLLPGAGRVAARGKTVSQLKQYITTKISRFKQLKVDISVAEISAVQVQVTGEVARPGTYVLQGISTVISALNAAGGPTKSGTLRKISIVRGSYRRTVDLYDFLLNGSKKQDALLEDGDTVFVPPVGATLTVNGEVVRPGRYEPDFPITIEKVLKVAGGVKPSGYLQTVQVERVQDGQYKMLLSEPVKENSGKSSFVLQPGDEVCVSSIRADKTNQVSISGPVKAPGIYGLRDNMRIADIIALAQGLCQDKEVYGSRADILRTEPLKGTEIITFSLDKALQGDASQNITLQRLDRVFIYEPDQVVFRPKMVTISGSVAKPGTYNRANGMKVSDAVAAAGGVLPSAYLERADLVRCDEKENTQLVRINLQSALNGDPEANAILRNRDELRIYTYSEVTWQNHTVRVEGAVQRPGSYNRSDDMRVSDLLLACGGLLPEAAQTLELAHSGADSTSTIVRIDRTKLVQGSDADVLLQDGDVITAAAVSSFKRVPEIVYISGEVAKPGPYALSNPNETLADLITRAGGLTQFANPNGTMFLRQKENLDFAQQVKEAEIVLKKTQMFADKQFLTQLAKMGVKLPENFMMAGKATLEMPTKVAEDENLKMPGADTAQNEVQTSTKIVDAVLSTNDKEESTSALGPAVSDVSTPAYTELDKVASIETSARISVDLGDALRNQKSPDNLPLRNEDRIHIPRLSNVVTVVGAVLHPNSFAASPGKDVNYYINRSGGYAQDVSKDHIIVIRANGEAYPKQMVRSVEPGDVIVVSTTGMVDIAKKWERVGGVTKVLSDILSAAFVLTRF